MCPAKLAKVLKWLSDVPLVWMSQQSWKRFCRVLQVRMLTLMQPVIVQSHPTFCLLILCLMCSVCITFMNIQVVAINVHLFVLKKDRYIVRNFQILTFWFTGCHAWSLDWWWLNLTKEGITGIFATESRLLGYVWVPVYLITWSKWLSMAVVSPILLFVTNSVLWSIVVCGLEAQWCYHFAV